MLVAGKWPWLPAGLAGPLISRHPGNNGAYAMNPFDRVKSPHAAPTGEEDDLIDLTEVMEDGEPLELTDEGRMRRRPKWCWISATAPTAWPP